LSTAALSPLLLLKGFFDGGYDAQHQQQQGKQQESVLMMNDVFHPGYYAH